MTGVSWVRASLVTGVLFACGWAAGEGWRQREALTALGAGVLERMSRPANGDAQAITYLAELDDLADFEALERLATERDDVLGAELYRVSERGGIAAIAFVGSDAGAIDAVSRLPGVGAMRRRAVPMLCH